MKRILASLAAIGICCCALSDDGGTVKTGKLIWQKCSQGQLPPACKGDAVVIDWKNAALYCKNLSLGGRKWRLPSKEELESLIVKGTKPAINKALFSNTPPSRYWSSTAHSQYQNLAWYVSFSSGYSDRRLKKWLSRVRCVSNL